MERLVLATLWLLRGQYFAVWQTGSQKVVSTTSLFFSVIVGLIIPHTHGIPSKAYFWPLKIKLRHSGSSVMRGIEKMAPLWKHSNGAYDLLAATPWYRPALWRYMSTEPALQRYMSTGPALWRQCACITICTFESRSLAGSQQLQTTLHSIITGYWEPPDVVPKADTQCTSLMENMVLSVSYWANYCENKPKACSGGGSENGVESNHIYYNNYNYDNQVKLCGIIYSCDCRISVAF